MSKQFKPVHEQFAERLIADLRAGTSPFQKPVKDNGQPAFVLPLNPTTGKNYRGMNALILGTKGFDDPRWMTANHARYAGYLVKEGAKSTLINFSKKTDIQAVRTVDGQKIKDNEGKTQTKTVEFDKAVKAKAFLFNGEQINDIPTLAEFQKEKEAGQTLSPNEQAEKLIADSKAVIAHGGNEAFYDRANDEIHLPEKDQFENQTEYYKAAIHQLAHWTGHESRLNRPMEGKFGSLDYAREELRSSIAAMLVGGELKIGSSFGQHAAYTSNFVKLLKDDPYEIFRASRDAQKMADLMLNTEQKREIKETASEKATLTTLNKGDVIPYKNAKYEVLAILKGKTAQMLEQNSGNKFKVGPKDKLYTNLVGARNNPGKEIAKELTAEQEVGQENKQSKAAERNNTVEKGFNLETEVPEAALAEENTTSYKMKR
jgi:antirestriction protein ArdC